jgi:hypothetical protein
MARIHFSIASTAVMQSMFPSGGKSPREHANLELTLAVKRRIICE